jgi:hypothetical protein
MTSLERIQKQTRRHEDFLRILKRKLFAKEAEWQSTNTDEYSKRRSRKEFWAATSIALMSIEVEKNGSSNWLGINRQDHWFGRYSWWISQELFPAIKDLIKDEDEQHYITLLLADFALDQLKIPLDSKILDMAIFKFE